jgi:hypothetical protein
MKDFISVGEILDILSEADHLDKRSVNTALPHTWVEDLADKVAEEKPHLDFVWSYEGDTLGGYPRPLTPLGVDILRAYNREAGTNYSTDFHVVDYHTGEIREA